MAAKTRVVALLESMWGGKQGQAPRAFRINPLNNSGRRLYRLVGSDVDLWVTNCCPEMQCSASHHGKPDPEWVFANLCRLQPFALMLVCGKVARQTYLATGLVLHTAQVIFMAHPAARNWSAARLAATAKQIAAITHH